MCKKTNSAMSFGVFSFVFLISNFATAQEVEVDRAAIGKLNCEPIASLQISRDSETAIRFASFNASLFRKEHGELTKELKQGSEQAAQVVKIIRTVDPDVFLLNEFDYADGQNASLFLDHYLNGHNSEKPWKYHYNAPVNTGVDSGYDLNRDSKTGTPDDAWGFGTHPGQYGMLVVSRFPIDEANIRTFQNFRWSKMPNAKQPKLPDETLYYPQEIWEQLRLSSKSHWDVPIKVGDQTIHFLTLHPTPPVFDGKEDRNGRRNHDEIRLIRDYACDEFDSEYIVDDQGKQGGLATGSLFIIAGDQNADPVDGDGSHDIVQTLLNSQSVNNTRTPESQGAVEAATTQAGANLNHKGDHKSDTADFNDRSVGNLRCDYVVPSRDLTIAKCGVFWPKSSELPEDVANLLEVSDHRLVWIDVEIGN